MKFQQWFLLKSIWFLSIPGDLGRKKVLPEHLPVQVLVSIIESPGLYWIDQSEAGLLNVSTLFHFIKRCFIFICLPEFQIRKKTCKKSRGLNKHQTNAHQEVIDTYGPMT